MKLERIKETIHPFSLSLSLCMCVCVEVLKEMKLDDKSQMKLDDM